MIATTSLVSMHSSVRGVGERIGFSLVVIAVFARVASKPSMMASFFINSFFSTAIVWQWHQKRPRRARCVLHSRRWA